MQRRTFLGAIVVASAFAFSCGPCSHEDQTHSVPTPAVQPGSAPEERVQEASGSAQIPKAEKRAPLRQPARLATPEQVREPVTAAADLDAEREVAQEMGHKPYVPRPALAEQLKNPPPPLTPSQEAVMHEAPPELPADVQAMIDNPPGALPREQEWVLSAPEPEIPPNVQALLDNPPEVPQPDVDRALDLSN